MALDENHTSMSSALEFRILGNVEVWRGLEPLKLGGLKQRMVLAMLIARSGHVVSVDELIDGLWPSSPPSRAVGTLQAYVSNLRRVLEPTRLPGSRATVLVSQPPGYVLVVPPDRVDAQRFEQLAAAGRRLLDAHDAAGADELLARATDLWRGRALAEFIYEPFAQPHIAALERRRLDALEDLFEARLALGRHADVVPDIQRLVAEEPTRERLCGQLMLALYRCGRQAEAIRVYDDLRRVLFDELGVDPSPEVRGLHERIVNHDPTLDDVDRRGTASAPAIRANDEGTARERQLRPLVGRSAELSLLTGVVSGTSAGGAIVVIEGDAGIGKTRMTKEFEAIASREGLRVVRGLNEEDDASRSYASWSAIVRTLERDLGASLDLSGATRRALSLSPSTERSGDRDDWSIESGASPMHIVDDVSAALMATAASRPLAIINEDIHWADQGSLALLRAVARRAGSAPIVVVATCRRVDVRSSPAVTEALAEIARLPTSERITLTGLTVSEIVDLVDATTGIRPGSRVAEAIRNRTDGNPFFISELVSLLVSERRLSADDPEPVASSAVPGGVRDVVRRRIGRLPDDTQRLLEVAAVHGREFDLDVVFDAADLHGDRALESTEAATLGRIIEESPTGGGIYAFSHVLVRDTLLEELGAIRRARLHSRLADVLLRRYGDDGNHLVDIAWHMWRAAPTRPREETVRYLARAGEFALACPDFATAEALLSRSAEALRELPPTPERQEVELRVHYQLALVRGRTLGTRDARTRAAVLRVEELSRKLGRPAELAHALWYSFSDELVRGDTRRASQIADRMLVEADRSNDATAMTLARASSGLAALDRGELEAARTHLETGTGHWKERFGASLLHDEAEMSLFDPRAYRPDIMCLGYGSVVAWLRGDLDRAREALDEAFSTAPGGTGGHAYPLALAMYCQTWLDALRRDSASALRHGEEAVSFARSRGLRFFMSACTIVWGWALAAEGQTELGLRTIEDGFAEGSNPLGPMRRPFYVYLHADALRRCGDAGAAQAAVDEALEAADRMRSNRFIVPELLRVRGLLILDVDRGAIAQAVETIRAGVVEASLQGSVMLERRAVSTLEKLRERSSS